MTYYKFKTARELYPNYADYIKLQTTNAYHAAAPILTETPPILGSGCPLRTANGASNSFLRYFLLKVLDEKPLSDLEIMKEIAEWTTGAWLPTFALVYPVLDCLQEEGYLESNYALTEKGKDFLKKPISNNTLFIYEKFLRINREKVILDCACGGGADVAAMKEMGFKYVVGFELSPIFIKTAKRITDVLKGDMHTLGFRDCSFDIVSSFHSIEHAYDPAKLLQEFHRILKPNGRLLAILPYPDGGDETDFHCAKFELGTNILDGGRTVIKFFQANGFRIDIKENSKGLSQEPLLWLQFRRS